ncbi:MAG TPA: tRNA uridine-5-carboxymethylaminomethyl(34) synthesis GTPase MnmE, partial [Pseudobdellovibrionaceae bacterium]|nr:tRNA uridine-5-carboxymethylaminomethyl(34) synthesis GTPase MnmE [Pseudobdellovibrionaceae bacterium]
MFQGDRRGDTICAVSSPHGVGGVSLIRLSGPQALSIVNQCLQKGVEKAVSHRVFLDFFLDREKQKVDQVLITYFAEGKSFTGEEVIEISCHGSPFICQSILNTLGELGARPADRG